MRPMRNQLLTVADTAAAAYFPLDPHVPGTAPNGFDRTPRNPGRGAERTHAYPVLVDVECSREGPAGVHGERTRYADRCPAERKMPLDFPARCHRGGLGYSPGHLSLPRRALDRYRRPVLLARCHRLVQSGEEWRGVRVEGGSGHLGLGEREVDGEIARVVLQPSVFVHPEERQSCRHSVEDRSGARVAELAAVVGCCAFSSSVHMTLSAVQVTAP